MYFSLMLSLIGIGLGYLFKQNPDQYHYFIGQCVFFPITLYVFYKELKAYLNDKRQQK